MKLSCPEINLTKEVRIAQWKEQIYTYIHNPQLEKLLSSAGYEHSGGDLDTELAELAGFMRENWDYRKAAGAGERWTIADRSQFVTAHEAEILETAEALGMIHHKENMMEADYIIPLGGARRATRERIEEAAAIWQGQGNKGTVVTLAAMRPLGEIEIPCVESYINDAVAGITTEYDVACAAMRAVFDVEIENTTGELSADCLHAGWQWQTYRGSDLAVLSAPSSRPTERRANSRETFEFFLEKYQVPGGTRILFTTSAIYMNYQLSAFIDLAIAHGLEIAFCGSGEPGRRNPVVSNYLQEIKGSVDAICSSLEKLAEVDNNIYSNKTGE